jgi:hypothetical protein
LLEGIFEDILSEGSIAHAAIDAELEIPDIERGKEEEKEKEDDHEFFQAAGEDPLRHFDPHAVPRQDSGTGLFGLGCPLISDYGMQPG